MAEIQENNNKEKKVASRKDEYPGGFHPDGRHEYATDNFLHAVYFTEQTANNGNQHAFQ